MDKGDLMDHPETLLCTHFNVTVVSEAFRNLNQQERVMLVYEEVRTA